MTLRHQQSLLQALLVPQLSWLATEFPPFSGMLQDTFQPSQAGKQIIQTADIHYCFPTIKITFRHTYYSHNQCFTEPLKSCFSIAPLERIANLQHRDAHLRLALLKKITRPLDNSSPPPPAAFGFQLQRVRWTGINCLLSVSSPCRRQPLVPAFLGLGGSKPLDLICQDHLARLNQLFTASL